MTAPEEVVREFFAACSEGHPERCDEIVSSDVVDYGHTSPRGLRLYLVVDDRITETRHALIAPLLP